MPQLLGHASCPTRPTEDGQTIQVEGDRVPSLSRERRRSNRREIPRILLGSRCGSDWDLIDISVLSMRTTNKD